MAELVDTAVLRIFNEVNFGDRYPHKAISG